jgi:hypothetical protein
MAQTSACACACALLKSKINYQKNFRSLLAISNIEIHLRRNSSGQGAIPDRR